ncbi:L-aspartate oxidase [Halanaerobium hydrogeniformans]|uniref:L-aspartate oxidase n=1 Tax=Halanaerobium hydrogeniformans TaxID=656519 RepID=E4RPF1_HALHG|nr:L-aspartate oxidase [Halanaerobium hydrogeniformans]ADQ13836.1 L-aspartate oxidase [Halanaerobium hydrogeniformans]
MNSKKYPAIQKSDFLVIGSGIAGLYTALELSKLGEVEIVTKENIAESNSHYAQGGIAAVCSVFDSFELHIDDTLKAGAGLCRREAVEHMVKEGPERIKDLLEIGCNFDRQAGELDLTKEGAHSRRRILHAGGDATGREISQSLVDQVLSSEKITVRENTFMIDLIKREFEEKEALIKGALLVEESADEQLIILADAVIIAAGGCGQLYRNTSNPKVTTGDGIAAAYRAGAEIMDMEFMQFHPTILYNPEGSRFLISESVRGEGGLLLNAEGERFMERYHELAELAPRDIVSRAITAEIKNSSAPCVYLDMRHQDKNYLKERFPTIYQELVEEGFAMESDLIPVIPAAHYLMGGIKTDLNGLSSLKGLYCCGEAACTGAHGANRLASNSLLEALVFAKRICEYLKEKKRAAEKDGEESYDFALDFIKKRKKEYYPIDDLEAAELSELKSELKKMMEKFAGIKREQTGLKELKQWLKEKSHYLEEELSKEIFSKTSWELKNLFQTAELLTESALIREESRGAHYRSDYPESRKQWAKKHIIHSREAEARIDVIK